jgi:hypothetical protein
MTTLLFNIEDPRLKPGERKRLLEISSSLYARDRSPARDRAPDPRALEAQHWGRRPDGDI